MRKKLVSLILAFAFIIAAVPAFSASAEEQTAGENKKLSQLAALGILPDMSLVEFEPERTVVKKVFYSAVYNVMTDEEESDSAIISFLARYNIKIDEAQFRDNVKREEALKAVVCMLGYTYAAPSGDELVQVANRMGLRKYVSGDLSGDITVGETVNLLYAAVSEDMLTVSVTTSNGRFGFERVEDVTPLNHYRDIYLVKGYVNKNSHASVVDNTPAPKGYVYIDDEEFSAGVTNAADYIGMPVVTYVQYDDDDEGTILYIAPNDKFVTVTRLDAEDIVSVDDEVKNIEYENGDKTKTAKLSSVVKVIFNGKNYTEYTKDDLMPDVGSVELIDSDNDRTIDVVNIKSYQTVLVNYASSYSKDVVSKYNNPSVVNLDSEENEVVIEKDGKETDFSEIKPNNILLVAQSRSGSDEVIKVIISDKQISGKISGIDYAEKELTADGKIYDMAQVYIDALNNETASLVPKLEIGKNYCLYLDAFGNVAYAVSQDGKVYLYTTRVWHDDSDDTYGMKAIDTEGIWKSYSWADKVKLNGGIPTQKNADGVVTASGNTALYKILAESNQDADKNYIFIPQLLRVEFNSEGKIKSIEIANDVSTPNENKFTKYNMTMERIYTNDGMTFGGDVWGTNNTKVLIVPSNVNDEDNYQATTMSWFKLDKWYQVTAYDMDKFYRAPMIVYSSDKKNYGNNLYYVKKISTELVNDEERTVFECLMGGSDVKLITASGCKALPEVNVGDVIKVDTNISGEIRELVVYTKLEKEIKKQYPSLTDATKIHASEALAAGIVTDVGIAEGMFLADCGNATPARFKFLGTTKCYLYDGNEKEKIRAISPSDINPGDNVYVYISYTKAKDVYVMRNVK